MTLRDDNTQPWERPEDEADYMAQRTVPSADNRNRLIHPEDIDDRDDEMEADACAAQCVLCTGPLVMLGTIGRLHWSRCRNCGAQYSTDVRA